MTHHDFQVVAQDQIDWCLKMLGMKGAEYGLGDRFHNFKVAAAVDGETPERALWGMWKKHFVSLRDIVHDIEKCGAVIDPARADEKIGDTINYMLLLRGMIEERRRAAVKVGENGAGE